MFCRKSYFSSILLAGVLRCYVPGVGMGLGYFVFKNENNQWVTLIVFGTLGTLLGVSDGVAWIKGP